MITGFLFKKIHKYGSHFLPAIIIHGENMIKHLGVKDLTTAV